MTGLKTLTFRTPGRQPLVVRVKNPKATLGAIATKLATKLGIAGTFECLNTRADPLSPETVLEDLPENEEVTFASELTPA